jgi:hypothetical protein
MYVEAKEQSQSRGIFVGVVYSIGPATADENYLATIVLLGVRVTLYLAVGKAGGHEGS